MEQHLKQILLPLKSRVSLALIKNQKVLVINTLFNTQKYIKLPDLSIHKTNSSLVLSPLHSSAVFSVQQTQASRFLARWVKTFSKPIRKQLLLKGLGLRGALSTDGHFLELKLGFSHLTKISTSLKELKLSMTNTLLIVEGIESAAVGNFLKKIRNLKTPDSYKGKGFWYKNESRVLKEIKKT
jgi:large subunit ribosomal protein L6